MFLRKKACLRQNRHNRHNWLWSVLTGSSSQWQKDLGMTSHPIAASKTNKASLTFACISALSISHPLSSAAQPCSSVHICTHQHTDTTDLNDRTRAFVVCLWTLHHALR